MPKTVFTEGDPASGIPATIVTAEFMNSIFSHRHNGADADGSAPIDYAVDTGVANAYAVALAPALTAYVTGLPIWFKAAHVNTGAATLALNGLTPKPIIRPDGSALAAGDLPQNGIALAVDDGTSFQLLMVAGRYQPYDADLAALAAIAGQRGDIIYYGAAGWTRLAKGASGNFLSQGANDPAWAPLNFTASLAPPGFQRLPSGLILEWGIAGITTTTQTHSFPLAFPSQAILVVGIQPVGIANQMAAQPISTTQFQTNSQNAPGSLQWIAVGY